MVEWVPWELLLLLMTVIRVWGRNKRCFCLANVPDDLPTLAFGAEGA